MTFFSCKILQFLEASMPNGRSLIQGRLFRPGYSCPGKIATAPLDQGQCRSRSMPSQLHALSRL
jgi:hypothetical protein